MYDLFGGSLTIPLSFRVSGPILAGPVRWVAMDWTNWLNMAETLIPPINAVYQRRRDMVVDSLNKAGWNLAKPKATIYIWAPVPQKYKGLSGEFATDLLEKAGVVVTPGRGYGPAGEGFFRISLTYPDAVLKEALGRIFERKL